MEDFRGSTFLPFPGIWRHSGLLFLTPLSSPEIWALWHKQFLASFPKAEQPPVLFLPAGERYKRLAQVESLAEQLVAAGADRDSILLAFGGGIIGDLTGFLAAIYMRGIRYVGIPTTILAQVDSSLGGKTGVNLAAGKNLIGSFHHPLAVFSDIDTLRTLPPAELRAGLQEAVKAGIIYDPRLFTFMEKNADAILGTSSTLSSRSAAKGSASLPGAPRLASETWVHRTSVQRIPFISAYSR